MSQSPWSESANRSFEPINPYAATDFTANSPLANAADAEVRKAYLGHEASVQGIGALYLLGAFFMTLIGGVGTAVSLVGLISGATDGSAVAFAVCVFYLLLGVLQGWVGFGLRRLDRTVRGVAIGLSVIGLLGIPIGTIISAYFLYLLAGQKGKFVFSDEYAQVRAATPEMKYRTSPWVWGILILLIALIVGAIMFASTT